MIDDRAMDVRLAGWLEDGPTLAASWVDESVLDHARNHPRSGSIGARLGDALRAVTAQRRLTVTFRPLLVILALVALLALGGVGYLAWRQNSIVPPIPTPSPSPSVAPSPTTQNALDVCPPGTDPDAPGRVDQARPPRTYVGHGGIDSDWRAVIDTESHQLALVSGADIWALDLCANTWRRTASTIVNGGAPVYDPVADLIVFVEPDEISTYDVDTDTVATVGETPVVGTWQVAYDSAAGLILARDERASRLWTYEVGAAAWREISQAGDVPPPAAECDTWAEQVLAYDASQHRLILYYGTSLCHGIKGPNTYEFDLASATWQRQAEVAPHFGVFDWGGPVLQLAYDAAAQRSVVYSVDRLATYDAVRHAWDALVVPNERVGSEYNHYRVAVAFDDVRRRTVLVGTKVTAVDVVARTSAVLVAGPPGPSSPPPIASPLR